MSYNIDCVRVADGEIHFPTEVFDALKDKFEGYAPEWNLFGEGHAANDVVTFNKDHIPAWCYDGSGRSFDTFKDILCRSQGAIGLVLIWEGGDSVTGLHVSNGIVEERKVEYKLVDN